MDTKRICPSCQKPLAPNVPMGLCPECLIKAGFPTGVETDTGSAKQPAFVPPTVEEITKLFPQLEILELIGKGGMGAVYKARQKQLNRFVALKILPPGIGSEPAFAERFTREAQALAQLNHPGIITLYEFGETRGQFYFLMEFVDGVNLRQLLAGSRISAREALAIVPQICDALQFAHDHGIVHRDIKPENILIDRRGRVKVADFGLAKIIESRDDATNFSATQKNPKNLTDAGKVMGTPNYMSPEQKDNPGDVDHRADIYALGVVFYQMLTGELPGKTIAPPSTKVQIDVRLDEIVLRALEKNPELRYQQVSEVKTCVETIAGTSPAEELKTPTASISKGRFGRIILIGTCNGKRIINWTGVIQTWVVIYGAMLLGSFIAFGRWVPFHDLMDGMVGVATVVTGALVKVEWKTPIENLTPIDKVKIEPRFSRTAITGLCVAFLPFLIAVLDVVLFGPNQGNDIKGMFAVTVFPVLALVSSLVMPILGWIAVSQIRHSGGKLYGLWLAVFDGLLFPLLALDGLIVGAFYLGLLLADQELQHSDAAPIGIPLLLIIPIVFGVVVLADFFIIRRVWRAVNADSAVSQPAETSRKSSTGKIITIGCGLLVLGAGIAVVSVHQSLNNKLREASSTSADFHYRVFEADAALLDNLIPAARRNSVVSPADPNSQEGQSRGGKSIGNFSVSTHGTKFTDAQLAEISPATLDALLHIIVGKPGLLADQTRTISSSWWTPGLADTWSYSRADGKMLGGGGAGGFLGFRHRNGQDEIRIEDTINHTIDLTGRGTVDLQAKLFYEGKIPQTGALAFLVPFIRKDDSTHYLVVVYEIGNATGASSPPFVARLNQGEVELLAVGNQPWTNTVCWLANGTLSDKPFPIGNGSMGQWAEGKVTKKIAFRIHNESSDGISYPIGRDTNDSEVSVAGSGLSWPVRYGDASFIQLITCPTNAQTMNFSLGLANGRWETVITLEHAANNFSGSSENMGTPEGDWSATWNAIVGRGAVAINCNYSKNTNWATRMVGVGDDGKITVVPENSSGVSTFQTGGILLVSSNEFAHIKEFQLQRRKYQWVEFGNVSLQSGHATTVEVKDFGGKYQSAQTTPATPASSQNLTFGPVMERTLYDYKSGKDWLLNLATGETFSLPHGLNWEKDSPAVWEWAHQQGVHVMGFTVFSQNWHDGDPVPGIVVLDQGYGPPVASKRGLYGFEMQATIMQAQGLTFENITPLQISNTLQKLVVPAKGNNVGPFLPQFAGMAWHDTAWHGTDDYIYAFQTDDGQSGVLQITGFTENPRGVKIRYKLVQQTGQEHDNSNINRVPDLLDR